MKNSLGAESQSATWSEYKHRNTLKYVVVYTADSTTIFVSKECVGRTCDIATFEHRKLLDILPKNIKMMTDRGFKNMETFLNYKSAQFVQLPSVFETEQLSGNNSYTFLCMHIIRIVHYTVHSPFQYSPFSVDLIPSLSRKPVGCTRYRDSLVTNG